MWSLHESYDPAAHVLYLFLIEDPSAPPVSPELETPKLLESFPDLETARRFAEGYQKALDAKGERVVRAVRCGFEGRGGCQGPGKPCHLGLDRYSCEVREP